ncbi:unnamed protein product [Phyllotreta striolata]|uniref:Protein FAM177A1 n=1 Tax=Phyllotreta striolata TaxID=444603 RepID=A0A9N9TYL8_PHYSR|nr:unnamed protein product [Phyllotreta striolata]
MVLIRPEDNLVTNEAEGQNATVKVKAPKRVLHFCDGVLEEYSSDEDDCVDNKSNQAVINPASLTWGPWFMYKAWSAGSSTLTAVDSVGEFLASLFGITTPRYYFEMEEYKRKEEERLKRQEGEAGWCQVSNTTVSVPLKDMSKDSEPTDV